MKKIILLLTAFAVILAFAACADKPGTEESKAGTESTDYTELTESAEVKESTEIKENTDIKESTKHTEAEEEKPSSLVIYADRSYGNAAAEELGQIKCITVKTGEFSVEAAAEALSDWTGLDFALSGVTSSDGVYKIDWSAASDLVGGIADKKLKEDFFFYDVDTLSWFMMDSLYRTVIENFGASEVYYSMDKGKDLVVKGISPVEVFPADMPYMGSPFYFSHADNRGEDEILEAELAGTWKIEKDLKGHLEPEIIEIKNDGTYSCVNSDGTPGESGHIEYFPDEYMFKMFDDDGNYKDGIYLREPGTFALSAGAAPLYEKD